MANATPLIEELAASRALLDVVDTARIGRPVARLTGPALAGAGQLAMTQTVLRQINDRTLCRQTATMGILAETAIRQFALLTDTTSAHAQDVQEVLTQARTGGTSPSKTIGQPSA